MRIATQVKVIIGCAWGAALVLATFLCIFGQKASFSRNVHDQTAAAIWETQRLESQTYEYLLTKNERSKKQWKIQYRIVTEKIHSPLLTTSLSRNEYEILNSAISEMESIFDNYAALKNTPETTDLHREKEALLFGQLRTRLADILNFMQALHYASMKAVVSIFNLFICIALFFSVIVASITFVIATRIKINILGPLINLQHNMTQLGTANFNHVTEDTRDDEIGDLARSFVAMSQSLHKTMASRDELNAEILIRKQVESHLQQSNTDLGQKTLALESAYAELESFSYSVSHDLRSPLRAIEGFSRAVLEDYSEKLDDNGKMYLTRVRDAANRMDTLIDSVLLLSRVSRADLKIETCNLSSMAKEIVAELQFAEPERKVHFEISENLMVLGDPTLLRNVLQNLIGNAWKYTKQTKHPQIEFLCVEKGAQTSTFAVRDNGAGFSMKYADKLFGAFQRLHSSKEFSGTGVGLAIVKRIILRHAGTCWAQAEVEKGATFYFELKNATS